MSNPVTVGVTKAGGNVQITYPFYEGSYTVTPTGQTQTLATNGRSMNQDVTVNAITVTRTANANGTTVKIGG